MQTLTQKAILRAQEVIGRLAGTGGRGEGGLALPRDYAMAIKNWRALVARERARPINLLTALVSPPPKLWGQNEFQRRVWTEAGRGVKALLQDALSHGQLGMKEIIVLSLPDQMTAMQVVDRFAGALGNLAGA